MLCVFSGRPRVGTLPGELRQSYFVGATSAVCIYRILSRRLQRRFVAKRSTSVRRHFGRGWSGRRATQVSLLRRKELANYTPACVLLHVVSGNWYLSRRGRWEWRFKWSDHFGEAKRWDLNKCELLWLYIYILKFENLIMYRIRVIEKIYVYCILYYLVGVTDLFI